MKASVRTEPVDVVIRPEDLRLSAPGAGSLDGVVTHLIFKGVHYEMEVLAGGFEWLVQSTKMLPGRHEGQSWHVDPFDIQIMHKPESEDEEAMSHRCVRKRCCAAPYLCAGFCAEH